MNQPQQPTILLIDDDVELTAMLSDYLRAEGFASKAVHDGETAIRAAGDDGIDAVVLDIMLPGLSGVEVLRRIRQISDLPVIMLTAKGDDVDRVIGLELGADDYVAKPYYPRELVARLRAVLRRHRGRSTEREVSKFHQGNLTIDVDTRLAICGVHELGLTSSEFSLLVQLAQAGSTVLSKDELSRSVLRRRYVAHDRSIDVHISNLRHKLAKYGASVSIETVRGVGYRLALGK